MHLAANDPTAAGAAVLTPSLIDRIARVNELHRHLRGVGIEILREDVTADPPVIEIRRDTAVSIAPLLNLAAPRDLYWTHDNTRGNARISGVRVTWKEQQ